MKINNLIRYLALLLIILTGLLEPFSLALAADEAIPAPVLSSEGSFAWGLGAKPARSKPGVNQQPRLSPTQLEAAVGAAATLPTKIDYSAFVPPVGNQGGQGSCVGWAVGYYYKTIQEYRQRRWSLTDPTHQFSPSFIYNQINGGYDSGSWPSDAFELLKQTGEVSISAFPYNVSDYLRQPSASLKAAAASYKAKSWAYLFYNTGTWPGQIPNPSNTVDLLRQYLALGDVFVITIPIYDTWDNVGKTATSVATTPASNKLNTYRGDHEVTVIGYDDTISSTDGTGAFRVVNQWGTGWGNNGYTWLSYAFVQKYGWDASAMTDLIEPEYTPVTTTKDGSPNLSYSANWSHLNDATSLSGTVASSAMQGETLDFSFYGNSVAWIGPLSQQAGVADVYLDGVFQQRVDQWREGGASPQSLVYYRGDLPLNNHTLKIVVQGPVIEHCPGNWSCTPVPARGAVTVDALLVNLGYFDDTSSALVYNGKWLNLTDAHSLNITESSSSTAGSSLTFNFTGSSIAWVGATRPNGGRADVYLDGNLVASVELYNANTNYNQLLFSQGSLSPGSHSLKIVVRADKNPLASPLSASTYVTVDYLLAY